MAIHLSGLRDAMEETGLAASTHAHYLSAGRYVTNTRLAALEAAEGTRKRDRGGADEQQGVGVQRTTSKDFSFRGQCACGDQFKFQHINHPDGRKPDPGAAGPTATSTLPATATRPFCGRPRGAETFTWLCDAMAHCRAHASLAWCCPAVHGAGAGVR